MKLQTMMFSATFPDDVQKLAQDLLDPSYLFIVINEIGQATESVEQQFQLVSKFFMQHKLCEILTHLFYRLRAKLSGTFCAMKSSNIRTKPV